MRTRLLLAFVATAVATLGVAALALFSPLQQQLRDEAVDRLRTAVLAERPRFEAQLTVPERAERERRLFDRALALRGRTDSRVLVFTELPREIADTDAGADDRSPLRAAIRALIDEDTAVLRRGDRVVVAARLFDRGVLRGVVVAERRLTDVAEVVAGVRRAFLAAAAVGLVVALAFGLALSETLSRRLGRLRDAALRITSDGPVVPVPQDATRDEVGDLSRAFARMQASLRRQEEARRAFVSTASHELRTPLTMLTGTLELLEEDLRDGHLDHADAREQVGRAQAELRRLARLATELLDLSRLDADVPLRREPVELGELARAVAAEFALTAADRDVRLDVVPPPGPVWAGGDPGAVARVLRILLENALRYAPEGLPVRVVPAYHGEHATLAVADLGPGVAPADRERVFERFQRGPQSSGSSGFGLGLAIGRELARRMGGDLALEAPGDGAVFRLELPIDLPSGGSSDDPGAVQRKKQEPGALSPP